jgi:hypothetical protein
MKIDWAAWGIGLIPWSFLGWMPVLFADLTGWEFWLALLSWIISLALTVRALFPFSDDKT